MLLLLEQINLPVFVYTHYNVIRPVLLSNSTHRVQQGQWPQRQSHLWLLVSSLHSASPSYKSSLAEHLYTLAMNQIRELICIKTNPKEA